MNEIMALELLKSYAKTYRRVLDSEPIITKQFLECLDTVLDLIEDQQKEIEELKEIGKENCISKDKIREKIKEIEEEDKKYKSYTSDGRENTTPEYWILRPYLKELLGE